MTWRLPRAKMPAMPKPVFRIAHQRKTRLWKLLPNEHTHPALYPELQQAIDYARFRCPPGGGIARIKDQRGNVFERELEPEGQMYGYFENAREGL